MKATRWLLAVGLGVMGGFLGVSYNSKIKAVRAENPRELYHLTESQINAFRRNDFPAAYGFAASGIRQKFPLERFSEMVRKTYPHLIQSGRLNFGEAQFVDPHASAMIYVSNGTRSVPMIYAFIKENGEWKIEGVQMLRSDSNDFSGGEPRI